MIQCTGTSRQEGGGHGTDGTRLSGGDGAGADDLAGLAASGQESSVGAEAGAVLRCLARHLTRGPAAVVRARAGRTALWTQDSRASAGRSGDAGEPQRRAAQRYQDTAGQMAVARRILFPQEGDHGRVAVRLLRSGFRNGTESAGGCLLPAERGGALERGQQSVGAARVRTATAGGTHREPPWALPAHPVVGAGLLGHGGTGSASHEFHGNPVMGAVRLECPLGKGFTGAATGVATATPGLR
jgi:hypothetical protein